MWQDYNISIRNNKWNATVWSKISIFNNKSECVGIDHFNDPEAFIEYSNDMPDVYKSIGDCNPDPEKRRSRKKNINSFWRYDCWYDS